MNPRFTAALVPAPLHSAQSDPETLTSSCKPINFPQCAQDLAFLKDFKEFIVEHFKVDPALLRLLLQGQDTVEGSSQTSQSQSGIVDKALSPKTSPTGNSLSLNGFHHDQINSW